MSAWPEELLHAAQIAARFEQMGREGVAEHVRMHVRRDAPARRAQAATRSWTARTPSRRPRGPYE